MILNDTESTWINFLEILDYDSHRSKDAQEISTSFDTNLMDTEETCRSNQLNLLKI